MPRPDPLLALIEDHLSQTGLAPTVFGLQVVGDPNFVRDLRAGREPRRATADRVLAALKLKQSAQAPA